MDAREYFAGPAYRKGDPAELPGWCTVGKAIEIYEAILELGQPVAGVEIGVLGGRSLLPAAFGARDGPGGYILGLDPYTAASATEFEPDPVEAAWWSAADFSKCFLECVHEIHRLDLARYCGILRSPAENARQCVGPLNYLHVDGNHNGAAVTRDLRLFLFKLVTGAILVLDDTNDAEVRSAMQTARVSQLFEPSVLRPTYEIWRRK